MEWYLLLPILALAAKLLWTFLRGLDSDLLTFLYSKFGKSPKVLKGKVIWITGASSGIGEQLAYQCARVGAKLALSGTRADRLQEVKKQCLELNSGLGPNQVIVVPFDISDLSEHQKAIVTVCQHFGSMDILINNAGRYQLGHFEDGSDQEDLRTFSVNVLGNISLTRMAVKHFIARNKPGHVAVTSSIAAMMPGPMASAYAASKSAINGYFESLRSEFFYRNISVTIAVPGPVRTELFSSAADGQTGAKLELIGMEKRIKMMTAERAAELFLVAIANRMQESWQVVPELLGFAYLAHYMPSLVKSALPWMMTDRHLERFGKAQF